MPGATENNRIVLDTNIIISALIFGGNPQKLLQLTIKKRFIGISSPALLLELEEVLRQKFQFDRAKTKLIIAKLKQDFIIVNPEKKIQILADEPDNRVLEAAITGEAKYIITGDKELLALKQFKTTQIITIATLYQDKTFFSPE